MDIAKSFSPTTLAAIGAAGMVTSWAATGLMLRYARARSMFDIPNHRSSHTAPVPRGGGAAIVGVFLLGLSALSVAGAISARILIAVGGGAALVAAIGWIDDRRGVPARYRALVQAFAAVWTIAGLGGFPALSLGTASVSLGLAGPLLAILGMMWYTNLFNFMDGVDGIAGGHAVASGLACTAFLLAAGRADLAAVALLLSAASAGFLVWNWSPAKIFMGDVGSSMLGFTFAALAIAGENAGAMPVLVALALGAPFIVDATLTLLRRVGRGERWYEAHRSHAYQRAVRSGMTHSQVALVVIGLDLAIGTALVLSRRSPAVQLPVIAVCLAVPAALYLLLERRKPMHDPS